MSMSNATSRWISMLEADHPGVDVERIAGVPVQMMHAYAQAVVRHARAHQLDADQWFADVVGFEGVWGEGSDEEMAIADLLAAIPEWAALKLSAGGRVPVIEGFDVNLSMAG